MLYQLVHHDSKSCTFVCQSTDLQTDADRDEWFAAETFGRKLPKGREWGFITPDHPSWKASTLDKPVAAQPIGDSQTFEQIITAQKEVWKKEQYEAGEAQARYDAYIAAYKG